MKKLLNAKLDNKNIISIACSVKGEGKAYNQDCFLLDNNDDCVMCFLADGLGSAINSEIGSEAVCRIACDIVKEQGVIDDFALLLKERWIKELRVKPVSCDTTFKFVVIKPDEIIFGGIGDGWIIGIIDNEYFELKDENIFTNQTDSMMSVEYNNKFKIIRKHYKTLQIVSIASDGFSEDIDGRYVKNFLKDCAHEMADAGHFLDDLEKMIENWPIITNHDDKSVVFTGEINE